MRNCNKKGLRVLVLWLEPFFLPEEKEGRDVATKKKCL